MPRPYESFRALRTAVVACACLLSGIATAQVADGILFKVRPGYGAHTHQASRWISASVGLVHDGARVDVAGSRAADFRRRLAALRKDPRIEYAEPNYLGKFEDLPAPAAAPNDPEAVNAWWINALNARQAWAVSSGRDITVALLDTGIDLSHADLAPNIRSDGFNFGDGNSTPQDQSGHGTNVAGLVAAVCNNGIGACGIASQARLLPVKINQGATLNFDSATLAAAIRYASSRAQVINLSLTVAEQTQTVAEALDSALAAGVVVVAAAGNGGGAVAFPASYPGIIAVSSVDESGRLVSSANRGPQIALLAPGVRLASTRLGGGSGTIADGTSFAAPLVSGTVAQLLAVDSRLNRDQVRSAMISAGNTVTDASGNYIRLNSGKAMVSRLPDLVPSGRSFPGGSTDALALAYTLPLYAGPVDLYVAIDTPAGSFCLLPSGQWSDPVRSGYVPFVQTYSRANAAAGPLFGEGGAFPAISLAGFPAGRYVWRAAAVNATTGKLVGTIVESPIQIEPH